MSRSAIHERSAAAYGIPGIEDGNNVIDVYEDLKAVETWPFLVRPVLIEVYNTIVGLSIIIRPC